ncbi:AAA family ATPase [Polynucleobacter sp. AP-Nickl1-40-C4]|jgi:predicted ATPase|uniref:AAA family ATPase n=1 Tax=Polynucleobacter sp. AP-Nickl1-40-C4 TaxID=3108275 RepID=UPI002B23A246|nr:AAA family ATPase [Polynucleobacter sp. AP-Nickl1-40-C4]MEA9569080.1 AAA family ATPase [Polynucleobacter sp. AP-Nickl1-40-C4]
MKIQKIIFSDHPIFKNHEVDFEAEDTEFVFLVGNNGSGKTSVLETVYRILTQGPRGVETYRIAFFFRLSPEELASLPDDSQPIKNHNIKLTLNFKNGGYWWGLTDRDGNALTDQSRSPLDGGELLKIMKIIYSTVETSFKGESPKGVTAKNSDELEIPKEESINLSKEIPQLLVDIKALDDAEGSFWLKNNEGKEVGVIPHIERKFDRFTNAFDILFDNSKKFIDIRNVNGAKSLIFKDKDGTEVGLESLSTGECQVIFRVAYILKNLGKLDGGIILIDEPELSLHPLWQEKYRDFLAKVFQGRDVQFIIATHSPYIFHGMNISKDVCVKINRREPRSSCINLKIGGGLELSPNLVSYLAYDISSTSLHIELFALLFQKVFNDVSAGLKELNEWLQSPEGGSLPIEKSFSRVGKNGNYKVENETLPVWIRNKIHHPEEGARPDFSRDDLRRSLDVMIKLLRTHEQVRAI